MLQKIACKLTGSPTLLALVIPIALASRWHPNLSFVPRAHDKYPGWC